MNLMYKSDSTVCGDHGAPGSSPTSDGGDRTLHIDAMIQENDCVLFMTSIQKIVRYCLRFITATFIMNFALFVVFSFYLN